MTGQRGVFDVDQDRALEALRATWGEVYDIGAGHRQWTASRPDGTRRILTGRVPDELYAALRADWGIRRAR